MSADDDHASYLRGLLPSSTARDGEDTADPNQMLQLPSNPLRALQWVVPQPRVATLAAAASRGVDVVAAWLTAALQDVAAAQGDQGLWMTENLGAMLRESRTLVTMLPEVDAQLRRVWRRLWMEEGVVQRGNCREALWSLQVHCKRSDVTVEVIDLTDEPQAARPAVVPFIHAPMVTCELDLSVQQLVDHWDRLVYGAQLDVDVGALGHALAHEWLTQLADGLEERCAAWRATGSTFDGKQLSFAKQGSIMDFINAQMWDDNRLAQEADRQQHQAADKLRPQFETECDDWCPVRVRDLAVALQFVWYVAYTAAAAAARAPVAGRPSSNSALTVTVAAASVSGSYAAASAHGPPDAFHSPANAAATAPHQHASPPAQAPDVCEAPLVPDMSELDHAGAESEAADVDMQPQHGDQPAVAAAAEAAAAPCRASAHSVAHHCCRGTASAASGLSSGSDGQTAPGQHGRGRRQLGQRQRVSAESE